MAEKKDTFDVKRFYFDLDAARVGRGLTWKQLGAAVKVNPSTFSRMAQGSRPDASALASLCAWSGLNAADYVSHVERTPKPDTLTQISASLSKDPNLTPENAAAIRDTIQKLYDALMRKPKGP